MQENSSVSSFPLVHKDKFDTRCKQHTKIVMDCKIKQNGIWFRFVFQPISSQAEETLKNFNMYLIYGFKKCCPDHWIQDLTTLNS